MFLKELQYAREEYDIVIVGCGPAGCTAAKGLGKKFDVLTVEASSLPRNKPCGGLLVKEAQKFLENENMLSKEYFAMPKSMGIKYENWNSGEVSFVEKKILNIDRKKFDSFLFRQINFDYVDVLQRTRMLNFEKTANGNEITLFSNGSTKKILCEKLIGCDGAASKIRRKILQREPQCYVAVQERIDAKLNQTIFIFDKEITDYYAWVIPKGNTAVVGAALLEEPKKRFELLKYKLQHRFGASYREKEASLILKPKAISDIFLGKNNILLCGEAAGLISPTSGEGISFALYSGKFVGKALIKNFENPLEYYREYCKPLIERIQQKFEKIKKMRLEK